MSVVTVPGRVRAAWAGEIARALAQPDASALEAALRKVGSAPLAQRASGTQAKVWLDPDEVTALLALVRQHIACIPATANYRAKASAYALPGWLRFRHELVAAQTLITARPSRLRPLTCDARPQGGPHSDSCRREAPGRAD